MNYISEVARLRNTAIRHNFGNALYADYFADDALGWRMKILALLIPLAMPAIAENCRVLVDGIGCRTRQLAVERIFEKIPGVNDVDILPRAEAPALNQRYILIRSTHKAPSREQLIEALGKRAKHYHVISVVPDRLP